MTGLRVLLAEDDVLLREGLASLLERSGYEVAGRAGDGTQPLMLARETRPDLIVTVEKHISRILTRLNLHEAGEDHRRVLAAITFLKAG